MSDLRAIIFWSCAEYCDSASKLTIKCQENQVRIEIWSSGQVDIDVKTYTYSSLKKAYKEYKIKIGDAILGGWSVLSLYPKRETWETKRSK